MSKVESMRAVVQSAYGTADVLSVGTRPKPSPAAGEVLLEVHAAAIDRGTWHVMVGRPYIARLFDTRFFGLFSPKRAVPGLDAAGVVAAVGEGVSRFAAGDRVFGIAEGSLAEYAVAREDKLVALPRGLAMEEAAVLGISGLTALDALTREAGLVAGERVLVIGASGGVGSYAVQLARALGAEVTGVCSAQKADLVRALGASVVFDYRQDDFLDGSVAYDVVLDIAGGAPVSHLRRALTPKGRLVFVGNETGGDFMGGMGRPLGALFLNAFSEQRFRMLIASEAAEGLERLATFAEEGALRPAIDRRVSLEGVADAMRDLEAGRVRGKVAVTVR